MSKNHISPRGENIAQTKLAIEKISRRRFAMRLVKKGQHLRACIRATVACIIAMLGIIFIYD